MSALEIRRVPGAGTAGTCSVPGCTNSGRYEYFILGYPIFSRFGRELICEKHGKEWKALFREMAPSRSLMERTIASLSASATRRTDAVDQLRAFGFSPEACARAVKETSDGREPGEILDRLLGVVELEAVA